MFPKNYICSGIIIIIIEIKIFGLILNSVKNHIRGHGKKVIIRLF